MHADWGAIGAVLALITLLALAATVIGGSFRTASNAKLIGTYRDAADAYEKQTKAQEFEISDLRNQLGEREKEIIELRGRVGVLQDMVTGKSAVEQLVPQILSVRDELLAAIRAGQ